MENIILNTIGAFIAAFFFFISVYYEIKYNKLKKQNKELQDDIKGLEELLECKTLREDDEFEKLQYKFEELKEELEETKERRDKIYNKHSTQIAYYKKRFLSLMISIKDNFKGKEAFIELLKNDFYMYNKKQYKELIEIEKKLDKKQK